MAAIRLLNIDGYLYFPTGDYDDPTQPAILIRRYDAGDCDTCPWPFNTKELRERLACALFDERECNDTFKIGSTIELPDGTVFDFDQYVR